MTRLPILGTGDKLAQKHLPAHLDPTTMAASSVADKARANHTGTQTAATISDLLTAISSMLVAGSGISITADGLGHLVLTSTGAGTGSFNAAATRATTVNRTAAGTVGVTSSSSSAVPGPTTYPSTTLYPSTS